LATGGTRPRVPGLRGGREKRGGVKVPGARRVSKTQGTALEKQQGKREAGGHNFGLEGAKEHASKAGAPKGVGQTISWKGPPRFSPTG